MVFSRLSWLSRDPIAESGGLNLYNFVANNPVNYWDNLGLERNVGPQPNFIAVTPFGEMDEHANGVEITRKKGDVSAYGMGGIVVTAVDTPCCCGQNKGTVVLVQLIDRGRIGTDWEVDSDIESQKRGRYKGDQGYMRVYGYTDEFSGKGGFPSGNWRRYWKNGKKVRGGGQKVSGYVDVPGGRLRADGVVIPLDRIFAYDMHFRTEAFCRCAGTDDVYLGKSANFSYRRESGATNGTLYDVSYNDGTPASNPSLYPEK